MLESFLSFKNLKSRKKVMDLFLKKHHRLQLKVELVPS